MPKRRESREAAHPMKLQKKQEKQVDEESEHESDTDRENDTEDNSELEDEEDIDDEADTSIENKEIALRYDTTVEGGQLVAVMDDDTDSFSERKVLWELIEDQSFQDNTLLFYEILTCKSLDIMMLFPPGSGKTVTSELFARYIDTANDPAITTWLDEKCQFSEKHPEEYKKYRNSFRAILINFERVRGKSKETLLDNLKNLLVTKWFDERREDDARKEEERLEGNVELISGSLLRLLTIPGERPCYLILDSVDTVFHQTLNLPTLEDTQYVQYLLIQLIRTALRNCGQGYGRRKMNRVLIFGVAPTIESLFARDMKVFNIYSASENIRRYFTYTEEKIDDALKVAKAANPEMKDIVELRKEIVDACEFKYEDKRFLNPFLCHTYITAVKDKKCVHVPLVPPSIWFSWIFTTEDIKGLQQVLLNDETEIVFKLKLMMDDVIEKIDRKDRTLIYPFFIYAGYLSVKKNPNKQQENYIVNAANTFARLRMERILDNLYKTKYFNTPKHAAALIDLYERGEYIQFCNAINQALVNASSRTFKNEPHYGRFIIGLWQSKYWRDTNKFHTEVCGLKPDIFRFASDASNNKDVIELKVILTTPESHTERILEVLKDKFNEAVEQVLAYAYVGDGIAVPNKPYKISIMIFYLRNVLLFVSENVERDAKTFEWKIAHTDGMFPDSAMPKLKEICKL